ncbi:hypothetical protein NQ318_002444 [Aromia moschata]|uniref:Mos1 transposase HTH domain-containing protein n=1 Tax=Aromia moschata TaxID=1265417 RepID=A0AAV8XDM6_9CUCU|nr:hypothetical protein NQ318_002444 [Aromia moschata]
MLIYRVFLKVDRRTMSEQVVPSSVAQRNVIKFLSIEGVRPFDILTRLQAQFGDETLSKMQSYEWHKRFSARRERVENESHDRHHRTSITEENICAVLELLEGDRRFALEVIAGSLGISYGSVHSIIHEKLDFRKVSARWVPRILIPNKKVCILKFVRGFWLVIKMKETGYLIA